MDTLRGHFSGRDVDEELDDYALGEDEHPRQMPPAIIGQDERRMQVRAYNFWASLLDKRNFPAIDDLDPESLPDFGPYSVLLDFSTGIENPAIRYLGARLAEECAAGARIESLADVPSRSLLSRITDHYMQILANQAPIGFEAEFINQRGATILYRGILLPFSSDDETIDFIFGVINWKEIADQITTDELLLEIDQALEAPRREEDPIAEWADGPIGDRPVEPLDILDLAMPFVVPGDEASGDVEWPEPAFGRASTDESGVPPTSAACDPEAATGRLDEIAADDMELGDWLASARELARVAKGSEDRSRQALYAAIGRAYDFSIAAAAAPEDFDELVADAGLTRQDRAPMTPVVKLVFGADYDKTRLTEYAAALGHAHRLGLGRGELTGYLSSAPGGLKGVVNAERRLRREESGKPLEPREAPRETLARKLRRLDHLPLSAVPAEGSEFTLLVARRLPTGEVVLLGEVGDDVPLLERAARKLLA